MDKTVWKGVVRRFWPGDLREMLKGYLYKPQAVFRSPRGELVKWSNEAPDKSGAPAMWWELRDTSGVLRANISQKDLGSMSIFRLTRYIIEGNERS